MTLSKINSERTSWDIVRIEMCKALAWRSTCWKKKTACIITQYNKIVGEGYNGTPPGEPHCIDAGPTDPIEHRKWSADHEIHGEINAILHALADEKDIKGGTMYTILSPCLLCAQAIHLAGITRVVYAELYKPEGIEFLLSKGILTHHVV